MTPPNRFDGLKESTKANATEQLIPNWDTRKIVVVEQKDRQFSYSISLYRRYYIPTHGLYQELNLCQHCLDDSVLSSRLNSVLQKRVFFSNQGKDYVLWTSSHQNRSKTHDRTGAIIQDAILISIIKKNWKCNNVHHSRLRKPRCSINHCFYVYWGHISLNNKKSDTVIAADTSDPFLSSYLLTMTCLLSQFCTQSHQKQALRCLI